MRDQPVYWRQTLWRYAFKFAIDVIIDVNCNCRLWKFMFQRNALSEIIFKVIAPYKIDILSKKLLHMASGNANWTRFETRFEKSGETNVVPHQSIAAPISYATHLVTATLCHTQQHLHCLVVARPFKEPQFNDVIINTRAPLAGGCYLLESGLVDMRLVYRVQSVVRIACKH